MKRRRREAEAGSECSEVDLYCSGEVQVYEGEERVSDSEKKVSG